MVLFKVWLGFFIGVASRHGAENPYSYVEFHINCGIKQGDGASRDAVMRRRVSLCKFNGLGLEYINNWK